jgi:hypothetical protein
MDTIYEAVTNSEGIPLASSNEGPTLVERGGFETVFHGTNFYALWSILFHAMIAPSVGQFGEDAAFGAGVYGFAPQYMYKCMWYAKFFFSFPQRLRLPRADRGQGAGRHRLVNKRGHVSKAAPLVGLHNRGHLGAVSSKRGHPYGSAW